MNIFLYTGFENLLDRWVLKADDNVAEFVRVVSSCIFDNFFFFWSNSGWDPVHFVTATSEWRNVVHQNLKGRILPRPSDFRQYYCKKQMF